MLHCASVSLSDSKIPLPTLSPFPDERAQQHSCWLGLLRPLPVLAPTSQWLGTFSTPPRLGDLGVRCRISGVHVPLPALMLSQMLRCGTGFLAGSHSASAPALAYQG